MTKMTYQIQIALRGSKPKIWRRILIPSDLLLSDFHKIIQTAMGWTNSHLHQFIKNRTFYTRKMADDDFRDELDNVYYSKRRISDLASSAPMFLAVAPPLLSLYPKVISYSRGSFHCISHGTYVGIRAHSNILYIINQYINVI